MDFRLSRLTACSLALLALCCGQPTAPTPGTTGNAPAKRLLVVTHTTGFRHDSMATAEAVLTRLATESRVFTPVFCRNAGDVARLPTPASLADTDGVFFANTTGNLGIGDLAAFLSWIREGHAFLGAHSAFALRASGRDDPRTIDRGLLHNTLLDR